VSGGFVGLSAVNSGTLGNYISIFENYFGENIPSCFSNTEQGMIAIGSGGAAASFYVSFAGGTVDPDLGDAWAVIAGEQYHYIVQPYFQTTNLVEIETELADRFLPLEDLQGHGITAVTESLAGLTSTGTARNSPHNTIVGIEAAPNTSEEWAAAFGAVAAWNLNNDPARPLHFLQLKGILPPPVSDRFERSERDTLLFDGIATTIVDSGGNVLIERAITTYQTNGAGLPDPSFLDLNTLATLSEIRFQYKARMTSRFIIPRFKLADDTFPIQPGSKVATPKTVKSETIALFTLLRDRGLIENLDDFIENLVVERNLTDVNRVDVLLPADLINQFRLLAGNVQFIL
jgi:phage tail sheath gpL-like